MLLSVLCVTFSIPPRWCLSECSGVFPTVRPLKSALAPSAAMAMASSVTAVSWIHMLQEIRNECLPPPKGNSWQDVLGGGEAKALAGDISWSEVIAPHVMAAPRRRNSHVMVLETKNKVTQSDARLLNTQLDQPEKDGPSSVALGVSSGSGDESDEYSSDSDETDKLTQSTNGGASASNPSAAPAAVSSPAAAASLTESQRPMASTMSVRAELLFVFLLFFCYCFTCENHGYAHTMDTYFLFCHFVSASS